MGVNLDDWCTWEYTGQDPPPWDLQICSVCGGTKRRERPPTYVLPCECGTSGTKLHTGLDDEPHGDDPKNN